MLSRVGHRCPARVSPTIALMADDEPARPVRDAATVVLLRDTAGGLEVYLQRRSAGMAFAAGVHVFPGGAVDPEDEDLVATAVREVEEETGVRLERAGVRPWARWVTPEGEPRRYDTRFFVAVIPEAAVPVGVGTEMDTVDWWTPAGALAAMDRGEIMLWPPTFVTLVRGRRARARRRRPRGRRRPRPRAGATDPDPGPRRLPRRAARRPRAASVTEPGGIPWGSGHVTERATCVLAPNPSPMTLEGTNTWVLVEPGSAVAVVVDPGPEVAAHHQAVLDTVEGLGARIGRRAADPRAPRPRRGGSDAGRAGRRGRGARARPRAPARRGGAGRTATRSRSAGCGSPSWARPATRPTRCASTSSTTARC